MSFRPEILVSYQIYRWIPYASLLDNIPYFSIASSSSSYSWTSFWSCSMFLSSEYLRIASFNTFSMDFHSSDGWAASTGEALTNKSITLIVNQISNNLRYAKIYLLLKIKFWQVIYLQLTIRHLHVLLLAAFSLHV